MTALKTKNNKEETNQQKIVDNYNWFYSNIYENISKSFKEFFEKDFNIRFMGISYSENILFYGDEYFVNNIPVTKKSSIALRASSTLISCLLETALGSKEKRFSLKTITDIEADIIKAFTIFIYEGIESLIKKEEVSKKVIQSSTDFSFTFYVQCDEKHSGKIILTIPDYMISNIQPTEKTENFKIENFSSKKVGVNIEVGETKITLTDIKAIEDGDIILLENSDINTMSILLENSRHKFKINPNPALAISIDSNGGNEMDEETTAKNQNMWDSILVDVVAEFDNVKLSLGELKQISEGLVIDVGSVYENKIKLKVENQVIATGELVILNDRYGVRVDNIKKIKDNSKQPKENTPPKEKEEESKETATESQPEEQAPQANKPQNNKPQANAQGQQGNENFDYSDFEIEDESI